MVIKKYPYLKDIDFLNKIYGLHNKTLYTNITVLDWEERRLQEIQGRVTSASMSVNGDSAVRRTLSLSLYIKDYDELYQNPDSLFTINKKVFVEVGLKNTIGHLSNENYPEYPTIWFPFGVFIISNLSLTRTLQGVSVNLSLNDKMALLNGEAGGTIPASTNFESYDKLGANGDIKTEAIRINAIIPELVNHFGNEALTNIIVSDIDDRIKQVMRWKGSSPLYLWENKSNIDENFYTPTSTVQDLQDANWSRRKIPYNYDCGYIYTDFVYPGELVAGAGDTVCTVLDKIKETLGNYEYFYDVFGHFIFREIKNYVNLSEWTTAWKNFKNDQAYALPYAYNTCLNSSEYTIPNEFIISYNNNPQFNMVKNDFIVWGTRKNDDKQQFPCRYHLAIDERPPMLEDSVNTFPICFDTNVSDKIRRCFPVQKYPRKVDEQHPEQAFPAVGEVGKYYYDISAGKLYSWVTNIEDYNLKLSNMQNAGEASSSVETTGSNNTTVTTGYLEMPLATFYDIGEFLFPLGPYKKDKVNGHWVERMKGDEPIPNEWRQALYFRDLMAEYNGVDKSYYYAEMYNEWPKIYDIEKNDWLDGVLDSPSSLDWWLDIIDNDSATNKFAVNAIGRRSYAKTESSCNCVFEPDIPNIVMVETGANDDILDSRNVVTAHELKELGLHPVQVATAVFDSIMPGGCYNSCYQNVRQLLTNYTDYNENISITCLPLYHLEPNTRITINDPISGIQGDYIINSISFDLSINGTMTITAKKVIEKI